MQYSDDDIRGLLTGIYEGSIDEYNLPEDLYFAISDYLKKGLYEGFGGTIEDFTGSKYELITNLRENVYMFSGAKTFQQVKELSNAIYDDEDKIKPFNKFFKDAKDIYENYNKNYARTEYDTAINSAQQASYWNKIEEEADVLPYLTFSAVLDDNTTDECEHMDGITAPVDDQIWDTCYPPNHWNCRSTVSQTDDKGKVSSKSDISHAKKETESEMQDVFKMNSGKDGYIFSPDHPYFQVDKADKEFAKDNFGLPIPEND